MQTFKDFYQNELLEESTKPSGSSFKDFYKKELLTEATIKRVTYDDFCSFLKTLDKSLSPFAKDVDLDDSFVYNGQDEYVYELTLYFNGVDTELNDTIISTLRQTIIKNLTNSSNLKDVKFHSDENLVSFRIGIIDFVGLANAKKTTSEIYNNTIAKQFFKAFRN